ncbi:MAG: hypothetical protein K0Q79_276 [Flavipsychrobacter sp.]|jgi:hypothetical protein|nr:hypothetical protein [Flavipsychrobacter sp.]
MEQLTFEVLSNYHKQEGVEEMAYLSIIFTVIFGLFGYFGTANKITKVTRYLIVATFVVFYATLVSAFLDSMKIHDALHTEIRDYISIHPEIFVNRSDRGLHHALTNHLKGQPIVLYTVFAIGLGLAIVFALLAIGDDPVLGRRKKADVV